MLDMHIILIEGIYLSSLLLSNLNFRGMVTGIIIAGFGCGVVISNNIVNNFHILFYFFIFKEFISNLNKI